MNQALLILLEKKELEFISVTEITKKAGVSRSTFYLHYESVYDLLEETIENLNNKFISSFNLKSPLEIKSKKDAFLMTTEFLVPYLNFCKENRRVLKLINKNPQLFNNKSTYKKMYDTIFYPAISQFVTDETQRVYKLEFFTKGVVAIIYKWLELDCQTEVDELIKTITGCIRYTLE